MSGFNSGSPTFPPKLIERCRSAAFGRGWTDAAIAVLRESGHAELVTALKEARSYYDDPLLIMQIDAALRKAGAL